MELVESYFNEMETSGKIIFWCMSPRTASRGNFTAAKRQLEYTAYHCLLSIAIV
jgi:hypothetical protein